jgi:hypothetical protein
VAETIQMRPTWGRSGPTKKRLSPPRPRKPVLIRFGRAWINGNEVGGTDPRYAHLDRSYD